jgi:hypothetical protein
MLSLLLHGFFSNLHAISFHASLWPSITCLTHINRHILALVIGLSSKSPKTTHNHACGHMILTVLSVDTLLNGQSKLNPTNMKLSVVFPPLILYCYIVPRQSIMMSTSSSSYQDNVIHC